MSPRQGGDSYPSGTPPYGVPGDAAFSRAGQPPQADRPTPGTSPDRDEPRTETTLTTRIKINIPGSRPIPEVVVRSPLNEETGEQPAPRRRRADPAASPVLGVMDSGARTATPPDLPPEWLTPDESTAGSSAEPGASSGWFAPRKKSPATPSASAPAPAPSQPLFQEQPPARPGSAPGPQTPTGPSTGRQTPAGHGPSAQGPSGAPAGYDVPYGSGRDAMPGAPAQPWPAQQPPTPAQTFGSTQQPGLPTPGQQGPGGRTQASHPQSGPNPAGPNQAGQTQAGQTQAGQPQPTLPPRPVPGSRAARLQGAPGAPTGGIADALAGGAPGGEPTLQFRPPTDQLTDPQSGYPQPGFPPGGFPRSAGGAATGPTIATPVPGGPGAPGGRPGQPDAQPGGNRRNAKSGKGGQAGAKGGAGNAAGQTATLPVPQPQSIGDGFAGGTGGAGADLRPEPAGGGQGTGASTAPSSGGKRGGGKGRKLAGYAVGALVLAGAGAYGAGLMLNQADIPKGTTVLGYSIGGDTRDQAVNTLTRTLGAISTHPLTVSIGGRTATLNPSVAGLTIDTDATVDGVAHHDYNPVTVIGSLFGHGEAVAPVVTIDEDKLRSALQQLASSSSASDASIHFTAAGKVVVTLPKTGSSLDVNAAVPLVEQAFKARAAGGQDTVVTLTVTTVQPKGGAAAANEAARTLGAWAMKQSFKVTAGGRSVPFGKNTFSQALMLKPDASGAFVPVFNLAKLSAAYGPGFDGAKTKDGKPVTPQDVAAALVSLLSKPDGPTTIAI